MAGGRGENKESQHPDLRWLLQNQASLDRRLERVENSLVFRTLRAAGRFYTDRIANGKGGYAAWRRRGGGTVAPPTPQNRPRFSLVVERARQDAIAAATTSYGNVEFVQNATQASGDYVAIIPGQDQIYAGALEHFAAALAGGQADVIYSDEEQLDAAGKPVAPVFKPDWSPILMQSVDYRGGLTAVRRELVNSAGRLDDLPPHVLHVPVILYGSQNRTFAARPVTPVRPAAGGLVSIVICTRSAALLTNCLNGIRARTQYPHYEIVVVQHLGASNSTEETAVARVIHDHGAKRVPYFGVFNFAAMNNLGAHAAAGDFLLLLNDDVTPRKADWLTRLVAWLELPSIGAVGARLTFPDGTLQHAGIAAWNIGGAWHPGRRMPPSLNWRWNEYTREVSAVTGACLAIRARDFQTFGALDTDFPVNFNDVDLCFRLRREGLSVIVDAEAELIHDESRTRGHGSGHGSTYEERRRFFLKWADWLEQNDPYYSPFLAQNNEELVLR